MKPEEVIKYLEMVRPTENYSHTFSVSVGNTRHFGPGSQLNKDVSTAIDLAIQALKKQVPKKVKNIRFSRDYELAEHNIKEGECPECGETMTGNTFGYHCGCCGVALDWGYDD